MFTSRFCAIVARSNGFFLRCNYMQVLGQREAELLQRILEPVDWNDCQDVRYCLCDLQRIEER